MHLNEDYSQRIVLNHHELDWVGSPQAGVERRMLDRIGGEVAKATSIVRYEPGSKFESHTHEFGEEILVLQGRDLRDEPSWFIPFTTQQRWLYSLCQTQTSGSRSTAKRSHRHPDCRLVPGNGVRAYRDAVNEARSGLNTGSMGSANLLQPTQAFRR
jgi:hypothetical protein